jgi:polyferredoxin
MTKRIPGLRPLVQTFFFFGFLYLLFRAAFPFETRFPVDLYMRLDPFAGLVTLLTQRDIFLRMLPGFGLLALVTVFGNFFCAWFCPLGSVIDFFGRILFREKKRSKPLDDQPLRRLRFGLFLASLAGAVAAWQVLALLDPISLITRVSVTFLFPAATMIYNQVVIGAAGILAKGSTTPANYGRSSTNVTFTVIVSGTAPCAYQWRPDRAPSPGPSRARPSRRRSGI